MLQSIRERAQGWIAWAIVILISIPFAFWGIQSYLGVGSEPVSATVDGTEITERDFETRYQEIRSRLRQQLGAAYRPELFDDKTMRGEVLDQMIRDQILLRTSYDLGLRASDRELRDAIAGNPAFQKDGRFHKETYQRMLELQGMGPPQYEENLRRSIVGTQLARAVVATEVLLDGELEEGVRLDRQQRHLGFVRVPKASFLTDEPISDDEVTAYYESNRSEFQTPERVKVQYLVLDSDQIAPAEVPGDDELRERYEAEIERFSRPEIRRVRHILVTLEAGADDRTAEAAKATVGDIRQRIRAGEDFAELAKELSEDPGSAGQGGDLGVIEKGIMDPAFEQAAFSLEQGQLSEAIRSQFGYHLIEVTEVEGGGVEPFEEAREELIADVEKRGSEGQFFDWAERLANLSYESPDSLDPAAEALGLELQTSGWIDRTGGEGVLAYPKVVAAAFSNDVLEEGNNSDLIEPEHNLLKAVVLRVLEHEEAAVKALDEVREQVVTMLRDEVAVEAAAARAAELAEALGAGEAESLVIGDYELEDLGLISRDAAQVPGEIRDFAFALARPDSDEASYGSLSLADGDGATVILKAVVDGSIESMDEAVQDQTSKDLAREIGHAYYENLLANLVSRARIERQSSGEGPEE